MAKPVVIGPYTTNFAEAMRKFLAADAMMEVKDEGELEQAIAVMLSTPGGAAGDGKRAQDVVKQEQGATLLHVRVILQILQTKRHEEFNPAAVMARRGRPRTAAASGGNHDDSPRCAPAAHLHPRRPPRDSRRASLSHRLAPYPRRTRRGRIIPINHSPPHAVTLSFAIEGGIFNFTHRSGKAL